MFSKRRSTLMRGTVLVIYFVQAEAATLALASGSVAPKSGAELQYEASVAEA